MRVEEFAVVHRTESDGKCLCRAPLYFARRISLFCPLRRVICPPQGKRESEAVREYAAGLAHSQWRVFVHERINRHDAPELLTIYRL